MPGYVYRFYDKHDMLLYVGSTINPVVRFEMHKKAKWAPLVVRNTIKEFPTLSDAQDAEKSAIQLEEPLFNKAAKMRRGEMGGGWDGSEDYEPMKLPPSWTTRRPMPKKKKPLKKRSYRW